MRIAVLGAGVIGVATAWYLRQAGHDVQVIDRREGPGLETSFANGGQISADHAAPWAKPGVPLQALKWMAQEDAPLLFRLRADPAQWRWGLQFLRNCTAERFKENAARLQRLGRYSRAQLQALRDQTGIQYDRAARGILVLYTEGRQFEPGMKTPDECVALEPAIATMKDRLVGGRMYPEDESGDAYKFTVELAKLCEAKGVEFSFDVDIKGFSTQGEKITSVKTQSSSIKADAYILALGSYSPLLARPLGIDLPIYPLKGYSVTMPVRNPAAAWSVSLSDEAHKLVLSRLGDRLRIAGTAELNGYNTGNQQGALRGDREARDGTVSRGRRPVEGDLLGRLAAGDADQPALHRPHEVSEPLPQYRARHARLDPRLRLRAHPCRPGRRAPAGDRALDDSQLLPGFSRHYRRDAYTVLALAERFDGIAGANLTLLQHCQIEAGASALQETLHHVGPAKAQGELVAGHPGLGNHEFRRAHAKAIADMHAALQQALGRQVLAEHAPGQRHAGQLLAPERVVLGRIRVDRLVLAAVHFEIRLLVALDVEPPDPHPARDRRLEYGRENLLALPFDFAGAADAHRNESPGHGPKLERAWMPQRPSTLVRM